MKNWKKIKRQNSGNPKFQEKNFKNQNLKKIKRSKKLKIKRKAKYFQKSKAKYF